MDVPRVRTDAVSMCILLPGLSFTPVPLLAMLVPHHWV
jgi:hypothetical protein